MWLSTRKSVDDEYQPLKIKDEWKRAFHEIPLSNTWVAYMDLTVRDNPS
ncbi:hypothetical protein F441_13096 [Phytophthora nicotianae CJ01A1]|uniref:Uncharacterized protein n=4 Tax=Phytophthora nicotianae TaxID=4792 RepID=V9DTG0_PHYNI|nr:hypothetical protein F443_22732 [Phytophthora nicotianae P1569]ETL24388.1 hypothetical protein L916_21600 [Phytophthora nicotianae]ETP11381.1 hypothetical protein F441_13096 [Phytophthora nicotianae CJ01A1]ETP39519.1 hypothetical protein F442_13018 [Phytophthora nicotianae P10297]ETL77475.1 hypothetical protein L917_21585 [Phytophthora nicotianae]